MTSNGDAGAFSATNRLHDGHSVIVLSGELDVASAGALSRELDEAERNGAGEVNVEISALSFIDSSGLAVLVAAQQKSEKQGRRLSLSGARALVQRVFGIAGLVEFLNVDLDVPTPDESSRR